MCECYDPARSIFILHRRQDIIFYSQTFLLLPKLGAKTLFFTVSKILLYFEKWVFKIAVCNLKRKYN